MKSIKDPTVNFRGSFKGTAASASVYGATNALYKVIFSYTGYTNAFNVANEVKVRQGMGRFFPVWELS